MLANGLWTRIEWAVIQGFGQKQCENAEVNRKVIAQMLEDRNYNEWRQGKVAVRYQLVLQWPDAICAHHHLDSAPQTPCAEGKTLLKVCNVK
jgi:hypothetical protein